MKLQITRNLIVNTVVMGSLALTVGMIQMQPAAAQIDRSQMRQAMQELGLSRSQMRAMAGELRDFKGDLEGILSAEQLDQLKSAQGNQQSRDPEAIKASLNLTPAQADELAAAREELVADLQGILTPEQVDKIMEMTGF